MSLRVNVVLGERSQELIKQYVDLCPSQASELEQLGSSVDSEQLIVWLCNEIVMPPDVMLHSKQEIEFTLASLRAELFHDLLKALHGDEPLETIEDESSEFTTLKLILLALAGTLLTGCEGFDSITTMLGVLSLPSILILIAGLAFSLLSIVVFYSYDLIQVAKSLGVTLSDAPKLLDVYLQQMNEIKSLRKKIDHYQLATLSVDELIQLKHILIMLQIRFQSLTEASAQFDIALNSTNMKRAKLIITCLAGLLFFGSGFFAGQSVAMFVAAFFIPVVLPTFWPVILFSTLVGVAAFALYWYLEHDGLNKLVSGWFGLDEDKIEQLCNHNELDKEGRKLELLKQKITSTAQLNDHLDELQNELLRINEKETIQPSNSSTQKSSIITPKVGDNIFAFHAQSKENEMATQAPQESFDSDDTLSISCK